MPTETTETSGAGQTAAAEPEPGNTDSLPKAGATERPNSRTQGTPWEDKSWIERGLIVALGAALLAAATFVFLFTIEVWPSIQPDVLNACKSRFEAISAAVISKGEKEAPLLHGMPFSISLFPSSDANSEWKKLIDTLPTPNQPTEGAALSTPRDTPAPKRADGQGGITIYCLDEKPLFVGVRLIANDVTLPPSTLYLLMVMAFGATGAFVYLLLSYAKHLGMNDFGLQWLAWYVTLPFIGAGLGATVYVVFRAGYLPTGDNVQINPFGFAATAGLAGLFSRHVFAKLRLLAIQIFTDPDQDEEPDGTSDGSSAGSKNAKPSGQKANG
jgi:hypothetical protein